MANVDISVALQKSSWTILHSSSFGLTAKNKNKNKIKNFNFNLKTQPHAEISPRARIHS